MLFSTSMQMCDVSKLSFYQKLLEVSNLPPANTCPIPKVRIRFLSFHIFHSRYKFELSTRHFSTDFFQGNYTFNNLVIDDSFLPNVVPEGEGYVLLKIYADEKPIYAHKLSMIFTYKRN